MMNNFFEGLKNQINIFCIGADGFEIFLPPPMSRKVLFKFLLACIKTLNNSRYFTGSRITNPPPPPPRDWRQLKANCEPQFAFENVKSIIHLF